MAFEFVAKKGFITPANATVSGSLIVYGGITGSFTGSTVGSLTGTSSYALSSSFTISASWAPTAGPGGGLATGSTYPITSSWSTNSLSSSFLNGPQTGSMFGTSSFAVSSSYSLTASNGVRSMALWSCKGTTLSVLGNIGGTLTRNAAGQYSFIFFNPRSLANYVVEAGGWTASVATAIKPTCSLCCVMSQTTVGFTMSFTPASNATGSTTDIVTASFTTNEFVF